MKKRLFLMMIFLITAFNFLSGQDLLTYSGEGTKEVPHITAKPGSVFEFKAYSKESYLESITSEMAGDHTFGELISKKIYLFNEYYTSEEPLFPGNPASKTVIKKPVIYESVKRIERDLKKSVKKGDTTVEEASAVLNKVLDVALNILTMDTRNFENAIESSVSTGSKIELFTKRVVLNY